MQRHFITVAATAAFLVVPAMARSAAEVGSAAPTVEPAEWLNTKGPTSWKDLKGRVILIDKWATWCGPCVASIPHLNELHEKFSKRGLTIIGVTDEASGLVKKFIGDKDIQYTIAIKGAEQYETTSIPHAWLIAPDGKIVWKGHPASLKDSDFEEHLKNVRMAPVIALPKELKAAEKDINSGNYAGGVKSLETHLKKPKSSETETAAKSALEEIKKYGVSQLQRSEELAKAKEYGEAQGILKTLEKSFKGLEPGDKASATLKAWKDDKAIKLELEGFGIIEKAEAAEASKQYPQAAQLLAQVASGKKFEGTGAREAAEKRLRSVKKKIK